MRTPKPMSRLLRCLRTREAHELPSLRCWFECHVGPLAWHIPGSLASRTRRRWFKIRDRAYDIRWLVIAAILNRIATAEMRHAALLLGHDLAMGYGTPGLLGHLHEYCTGNDVAFSVLYGNADDRAAGEETLRMERSLYARAGSRPPKPLQNADAFRTALSVLTYHHNARLAGTDTWEILDGIVSMCVGVLELHDDPSTWFTQGGAS
jgi:hypothetical protein